MSIDTTHYAAFRPGQGSYLFVWVALGLIALLGGYCAYQMEHLGHAITGMNNQVVWGLPHVFAVSLIVAASGALNAASFSSVFGAQQFKPYGRLSVALALSLLVGGLGVLVLDLGRPDRLVIAMTHFNFRSIFAWNIFIYTGFIVVGVLYLWMMMEKRFNRYIPQLGSLALGWRLVLTTGTGSIFGFLVGRNALDTALMAPLFIALSLVLGTALFILVLAAINHWQGNVGSPGYPDPVHVSLGKLLMWFVLAVAYFSIVHHLTNLYVAEHRGVERHVLMGPMSMVFWVGHIGAGVALPVYWIFTAQPGNHHLRLLGASVAAIFGSVALVYVVIIGSQSTPQVLFPGKTVLASRFGDAGVASYSPSVWEWGLGAGGVAIAFLLFLAAIRVLPFAPRSRRNAP